MKYSTIIVIFVLINISLNANENSESILLKSGKSYSLKVLDAYSWGVKLSNNQSCMYKQIAEISTGDSIIVKKIKNELPRVKVSQLLNDNFILDLNDIVYLPSIKDEGIFNRRSISLLVGFNSTPNTELRFTLEPNISFNSIFEFSYTLNWYTRGERLSTSFKPSFSFGFGSFQDLKLCELSILAKYMSQSGDGVNLDSFLISTNLQIDIIREIFLTVSWNYYFNGIKIRNNIENNVLYLGLGFNLSTY